MRGSDLAIVLADIREAARGFDVQTCMAVLDAALALAPAKVRGDAVLGLVRHERDRLTKRATETKAREMRIAAIAADDRVLGKRDAFDAALIERLGRAAVEAWFADVLPVRFEGRELTLDTGKKLSANWIASRLYEPTLAAARAVFGHVENVRVTVSGGHQ